jgi:hypothetical protein
MATSVFEKFKPGPYVLQDGAAAAANGNVLNCLGFVKAITMYIDWSAGCSAGGFQPETADDPEYAGTWAPLGPEITWSAASRQDVVTFVGPFAAVRCRCSTPVVGGTGDVNAYGAN